MSELVGIRRVGNVCVLTLQRPDKLNAISVALERALGDVLGGDDVRDCRALVITGEGRAFSAGADLADDRDNDPASILAYYRDTGGVYETFAALPVPTFAALHGYCLGAALELALAADFRIADETAVLGLPEVALGFLASSGGTHRLVRLVGAARAKELALLRDRVDAAEAHRLGLVTEVVPAGAAVERSVELATRTAALPQLATILTKQAIDAMGDTSRDAALLIERIGYAALAGTSEARDAGKEFARRRSE